MKSGKKLYICSDCGYISGHWLGRCPNCQAWDSFVLNSSYSTSEKVYELKPVRISEIENNSIEILDTGFGELNRCLGGGIYKNTIVLLAGSPGIGKSTLSLQIAYNISKIKKVLYVCAEENYSNLKVRFDRLFNQYSENLFLFDSTNIAYILECSKNFDVIFIDSIQAIRSPELSTPIGSISQVKDCIDKITEFCKNNMKTFIILAHVTKSGYIAGPKFLEHMVDVVLVFESRDDYRIIRVLKNRYGSTDEVGVFVMTEQGLKENNYLEFENVGKNAGSVLAFLPEGSRFIPIEIQALVNRAYSDKPKRIVWGIDNVKIMVIISIIEKFLKLDLYRYDIIMSIIGGLRILSNSLDFSIAVSIISSYLVFPVQRSIFIGNLSLYSSIEAVSKSKFRQCLMEASKFSVEKVYSNLDKDQVISEYQDLRDLVEKIEFYRVNSLSDLVKMWG
ncbi:MAG: ATPase domain-containing protein [Candidatus Calescibacterium sp.]|nr:AAA family ATPase [Candidatus Calescibacterium sp.]MCX7972093.1 AAA family ATPase [bacterium]MDW8194622.1 ATPase domain-containing protein [Candidatus Calescibacterium sp.]